MKMLYRLLLLCAFLLLTALTACADVPPIINYQGKFTGADGKPVADGTYAVHFAIYDVPTGGTPLWSETNTAVQMKGGLFSVLLGSVVNLPSNIFDSPSRFFGVSVGADPEMTPRQQIASVPFAVKARSADTIIDGAITTAKIADGAVTKSKMAPDATADLYSALATGWIAANETWTYDSPTTITVPTGAISKYSPGDKIRIYQVNAYAYFYVVGVADTLLTVTGGSDFSVSNNPIISNQFSKASSPVGFPGSFSIVNPGVNWGGGTTNPGAYNANIMIFSINGRTVHWNWWFYCLDIGSGDRTCVHVNLPITSIAPNLARYSGSAEQFKNGVKSFCGARTDVCEASSTVAVDDLNMSGATAYEIYAGGSYQF